MLASELNGRAVVTLSEAENVGHVDDVLFDPALRQVLGFRVKQSAHGATETAPRGAVTSVGRDAVMIPDPQTLNVEERFAELAGAATLKQARGMRLVSEAGEVVGQVEDIELDDAASVVTAYVLSGSLWERMRHTQPRVAADKVLRVGAGGIMTVPNDVASELNAGA
ncbi:MAG TPA: PRC-barrel domain-containing protein [Ktedonobacterales bacterium]|nr:PRC-barrel domain-containing protein [Ktedonobacterales bacterium]